MSALLFAALAAPPAPRALAEETNLVPVFSTAITSLSFPEGKDAGETLLPAAEGGDGQLTYSLTGLPAGMTFDAATRALGGTPAGAGEFSMTYTATDEDGDQASFSLTATVDPAPQTARSKTGPDAPGSLKAVRTPSATSMKPALDVTWTTPADNGFPITKYEIWYGLDTDNMTKVTAGATATSVRLADLTAGTTYVVRALAFAGDSGQHGVPGARADTTGKTNTPPTEGQFYLLDNTDNWGVVYKNDVSTYFGDDDNDTLAFEASSTHPGVVSVSIQRDGGNFDRLLRNPGKATATYAARDGYGGYVSRSFTVTVTANETRSVPELSPAGTIVGRTIVGTQPPAPNDNQVYTHKLTGEASTSGAFVIDSATGQISVAEGATLDYETKNSYTGKVSWTVQGQAAVANLTINVTDVAPDAPTAPTFARTELSEPSKPALDVTWTAPADNDTTITGYGAQYRLKVAEGETENAWTAYSGTLDANARTLNLAGLTAGAIYEVQVRAHSNEGSGPWSEAGEGRANRAPTTAVTISDSTIPWLETREYDLADSGGAYFQDPDGDTLTYSASATYACIIGVSLEGSVLTITALNPDSSSVLYEAVDAYGGRASRAVTITGSGNVTREVLEGSAAGTKVGAAITASPCGEEHISYGFDGEAATSGNFVIDHQTGQISVAEGATLDYETKSSYTGRVHWVVHSDQHPAVEVTINLLDIGAAKPDAPTLTRTRFSDESAPALDVTWTAPAANGGATITGYNAQYRKKAADGENTAAWTDYTTTDSNNQQTSQLPTTTTTINLPSLEAGATYEARVRGTSSEDGAGPWSDIGSGRANTPPHTTGFLLDATIPWGHSYGFVFDGQTFRDTDGDELTFFVSAANPGIMRASIVEGTPHDSLFMVAFNPGATKVTYGARDPYGGSVDLAMTATGVANEVRSVDENSAAGTAVGRAVVGNPYGGETYTHKLTGNAADAFVIDATTGQISVKEGASLDYETKDSYTGKVKWTVNEQDVEANLTIKLNDIEGGKPGTPTLTRTEFSEPSKPALDVTWTAAAANGLTVRDYRAQYRQKAADGEEPEAWTEYPNKLSATATSLTLPDLEAGATYEFRVRVRTIEESGGPWSDIAEGQANTPPTAGASPLPDATIPWGTPTDYDIGDKFSDGDGDTLTYSASSEYAGVLIAAITGNDGDVLRVTVNNPAASTVTYGVSDGYGGYASLSVEITGTGSVARSVAERSPAGTAVGDPVAGTPHGTETLTHTLTGEASTSGAFEIDSATGQISVAEGATLDYETKSSYTGQVAWTVQGQAALANLTIHVADLEAVIAGAPTLTRTEFSEQSNPALDVNWTAAANGLTITGYEAQYRVKVADGETANAWTDYTVEDSNGDPTTTLPATTTSINLPDLTPGATYEAQVRALTSEEGEGPWSDTGEGTANRPPAWNGVFFLDVGTLTWRSIYTIQNSLADHFADADGDTLTYSASSEYVGIINAWVEGDHPKLHVHNPAASEVTFRARDPYGGVSDAFTHTYVGSANVTRAVRENSPANTMLGDRVQGRPYNGQALTYTLTGEPADSGHFYIKPFGRIRVKSGANLDYETKSTYTGKVEYTIQGQPAAINVTINVIDVEAGKPGTPTLTRTEFSEPSDPALDVTWTAAAANGLTINGYEAQYREGCRWRNRQRMDRLHRRRLQRRPNNDPARDDHQHQPAGPDGGRDLRGAGARPHQRGGRGAVVGHRLRAGQPAADRRSLEPARRHRPMGYADRLRHWRQVLGRRRRHADVLCLLAVRRSADGRDNGQRRRRPEGHRQQSGRVDGHLRRHRRVRGVRLAERRDHRREE